MIDLSWDEGIFAFSVAYSNHGVKLYHRSKADRILYADIKGITQARINKLYWNIQYY